MDKLIYDLSGRVAMVAGASSGVGAQLARALARVGAKVVITARRKAELEKVAASIAEAGGTVLPVVMDITDEASVKAGFDAAEAAFGPVDTLYAIAGTSAPGPLATLPVEEFDRVMATNIRGVLLVTREGCNRMVASGVAASGRGRAVIMSSVTAIKPYPGAFAYSISKAAEVTLGTALAVEYPDICVNVICPGSMLTDINEGFYQTDIGKAKMASHHRRRLMEVAEIQDLLLFLGCDAARAITGSAFKIDDGQLL